MSLYGKNLRLQSHGDDVAELHQLLERAGNPAPAAEVAEHVFAEGTQSAVREFQHRSGLEPSGVVDDATATALYHAAGVPVPPPDQPPPDQPPPDQPPAGPPPGDQPGPNEQVVRGQVMYRRGLAVTGVQLQAIHRELRNELVLGRAVTDDRGEFAITYSTADVPGGRVDLQVRAFANEEAAARGAASDSIGQSRIFYAAPPVQKLRLRIDGGPETRWTEYQQTVAEISPYLDGLEIGDLQETTGTHDLSLLAGKTNQPLRRLADLVVAHRLAAMTGAAPEAMYGLVRRGLGTDLGALASQDERRVQVVLQSASDRELVPITATENAAGVLDQLRTTAINTLADSPDLAGGLLHSVDDVDARKAVITKLIAADPHRGTPGADASALWESLTQDPQLADKVPALQLNVQLTALTGEHPPLVGALADALAQHDNNVAALAAYQVGDFEQLITALPEGQRVPDAVAAPVRAGLPADTPAAQVDTAQVNAYATLLHTIVAETMPTAVLATTLAGDNTFPESVRTFWHNVINTDTGFDLRAGLRPEALDERLLAGIDAADRDQVISDITTVKRLFNITPDAAHIKVLLDAGLDSAQSIARLGGSTFIARYADQLGGPTQALSYVSKAVTISATSAAVYSAFSPQLNDVPVYVLPAYNYTASPDLETLFGSLDLCDCEDCQSVLSPAAYLAEILAWLGDRTTPGGGTARDELYRRRPDIGEIELSCANTNTTLPYTDLVIELLENLIAPIPDIALPDAAAADLDQHQIPDSVHTAFADAGFPLGPEQRCYVVTAGSHWFLTDHRDLWVLRKTMVPAPGITASFGSYQTSASTDELAAEPEHRNATAYVPLRKGRYPVSAPLDLSTEEVRTYIGHLLDDSGTPPNRRRDLMVAVAPIDTDPLTDPDIAGESLGFTVAARTVLTTPSPQPWTDFGLAENANNVQVFDAATHQVATAALSWDQALTHVAEVLQRYDVEYTDLVGLLDADFVNPGRNIRIVSADDQDVATCEIDKLVLDGFDAAGCERLRQFVRLRNQLGWTTRECDDMITALRANQPPPHGNIDDPLLVALSAADRLNRRLGIAIAELPGLWATLRADRLDDQYFALFGNPQVIRPLDPAFAVAQTAAGTMEIAAQPGDPAPTISGHNAGVMSALNITASELDTLASDLTDDALTIANLSQLYRYSRLAHALQLTVDELLVLRACADDPFPAGESGPVATERFVDFVTAFLGSGLAVAEMDYLLFHQLTDPESTPPLTDDDIASALDELRTGLRGVAADTGLGSAPAADALRRWLAELHWPSTVVDDLVAVLDGTQTQNAAALLDRYLKTWQWPALSVPMAGRPAGTAIPSDLAARVFFNPVTASLTATGPLTPDEIARLTAGSADPAWTTAVAALDNAINTFNADADDRLFADPAALLNDDPTDRLRQVAELIAARLRAASSRRLVLTWLSSRLATPLNIIGVVLGALTAVNPPARPAISDFLDTDFAASPPDVALSNAGFPQQFRAYLRLFKVTRLINRLGWTSADLLWLTQLGPAVALRPVRWSAAIDAGWWQPSGIPTTPQPRTPAPLAELLRAVALTQCARKLSPDAVTQLLNLAGSAGTTLNTLAGILAGAASRDNIEIKPDDLVTLIQHRGLGVADFRDETAICALLPAIELMRRTGASGAQLIDFAAPEPTDETARAARQVVKAHYDDDSWRAVAEPLRDRLRTAQRDALLAYVLADPDSSWPELHRDSDIYRHLLLDSRTEPIVMTSRIKQAMSSVQLFVQSAMMNLVPGVEVDAAKDPGWNDWAWMKSYRVWEANREVFCFPENWLDPSLRDDKTPLFSQLESALMRDDVTADVVQDAFAMYLSGLDDIARLEILGLYEVAATAAAPVALYALGRSRGRTPNFYWRSRIDTAQWTPWQKIDVDIAEPQVVPVVWNGQLYVFWPVFIDVTPQQTPGDKPVVPTNRHYDIALAYTYFHRNKWQPKQLTEVSVSTPLVPVDDQPDTVKSQLVLRALVGSPDLWVWPEWDNPKVNISTVKPGYTPVDPGANAVFASVHGFHFTGRDRQVETYAQNIGGIFEPTGTVPVGMLFAQKGSNRLNLPATLDWRTEGLALGSAPTRFYLAYAHQDQFISGARSFVYQDSQRTYVVDPAVGIEWTPIFHDKSKVNPAIIGAIKNKYYDQIPQLKITGPQPAEIAADPATQFGTKDPLRLAQLAAATPQVVAPALPTSRLLYAPGDQRQFVSQADKAIIKVGDYLNPSRVTAGLWSQLVTMQVRRYLFRAAFHPYVGDFQADLAAGGVQRLVSRDGQTRLAAPFNAVYKPQVLVDQPYPVEDVDFDPAGFFQQYNWELFFHAPVLIATRLSANQRFEDAQRWFHLVFDPTDTSHGPVPARFWQTKPLHDLSLVGALPQRLSDIVNALASGSADPGLLRQVAVWRANPFNPFAISRLRLAAYQKWVVMAYLDNLIAWGDQLFRQDTIESINYATNLYMLAADILGERPRVIPRRAQPEIRTAVSLDPKLEMFSDALVAIESVVGAGSPDAVLIDPNTPPLSWPKMLYFGLPKNDKLFGYWDTVADRLFKIRNSMNIEGVTRQLPLFEPRIDPALLIRARAAGLDVAAVLAEVSSPPPTFRFRTLATQAVALANDVRTLGAALLAALEKRDAEALALLRATNESELADAVERVKEKQVDEATAQIAALRAQRTQTVGRYQHYQRMLGVTVVPNPPEDKPITPMTASANAQILSTEGVKLLSHEKSELDSLRDSRDAQTAGAVAQGAGSTLAVVPTIAFDVKPWGIGTGMSWGGSNMAGAAAAVGAVFAANAESSNYDASKSARLAQAVIRENEWVLQSNQAAAEIMMIDKQRLAAEIRQAVATAELENHRTSMRQASDVRDYLADKYTNTELYDWMATQVSAMYFQGYQLAYDTAKRAERALQRELGLSATQYIQFGYWDTARKGLLAGERLVAAIGRMQTDFFELNKRTYEITKHVSLANVNPAALIDLRETGTATIQLPEALFDLDRPGDYCRRIKMVSLSLPCVTGPYTGINCKMTLLSSQIRIAASPANPYKSSGPDDPRFSLVSPVESVVTSSGRDDTGMFQADLRDERFLPFEGAGVIGTWRLELPSHFPQFDYQSISDAVITIRYTALDGGAPLRDAALAELTDALKNMEVGEGREGLYKLLSARHDYPDQWYRLVVAPADPAAAPTFSAAIDGQRFPFAFHDQNLIIDKLAVVLRTAPYDAGDAFTVELDAPGQAAQGKAVAIVPTELGGLPSAVFDFGANGIAMGANQTWTVKFTALPAALSEQVQVNGANVTRLRADTLLDLGMLISYRLRA
jgi:peptidoglycan hydrolase-like protein with peptidoglycan-binding domain